MFTATGHLRRPKKGKLYLLVSDKFWAWNSARSQQTLLQHLISSKSSSSRTKTDTGPLTTRPPSLQHHGHSYRPFRPSRRPGPVQHPLPAHVRHFCMDCMKRSSLLNGMQTSRRHNHLSSHRARPISIECLDIQAWRCENTPDRFELIRLDVA